MSKEVQMVVEKLKKQGKTIATMESCTGGGICNAITNVEGASDVFSFAAITYSNEYKIKMGVAKEVIDKYTVYSKETSEAMARAISDYTSSNYGVGVTGKLNRIDKNNLVGNDNMVYISIYNKDEDCFYSQTLTVGQNNRQENKEAIIKIIMTMLLAHLS